MRTHLLSHTKLYRVRTNIIQRIENPNHPQYSDYGGRGVKICDEWRNDINSFYEWSIENGYEDGLTIDRIEVDGDYEPSNCRWVTMREQTRNRRTTKLYTYNGLTMSATDWSYHIGGTKDVIYNRIKAGWSIEKALSTPVGKKR